MAEGGDNDVSCFFEDHRDELEKDLDVDSLCQHLTQEHIGVTCVSDLYDARHSKALSKSGLGKKISRKVKSCIEKHVIPVMGKEFDKDSGDIKFFLECCELSSDKVGDLLTYLEDEEEITHLDELKDLEEDDFLNTAIVCGLTLSIVELSRFFRFIQEKLKDVPVPVTVPAASELKSETKQQSSVAAVNLISICYIYCENMFGKETIEPKSTGARFNPDSDTMRDVQVCIAKQEKIKVSEFAVELFSAEGYPLNVNSFTSQAKLTKWGVTDSDLFYVFRRKKDQPGEVQLKSLPGRDHEIGLDTLTVDSMLYGTFKVKVDLNNESPEDVCLKVSSATKLPTTHMQLYARKPDRKEYIPLDVHTTLKNGDTITLVLKHPGNQIRMRTAEYGKKSYNMVVPQTDKGLACFFSILRYLCMKQKVVVDFPKLIEYLSDVTRCPPLIYALRVLYENSSLSLPCWVALIESFYQLIQSWIHSFCDGESIDDRELFEFSDYFFATLMKKVNDTYGEDDPVNPGMEVEKVSLLCPISGIKIVNPVHVLDESSEHVFDKQSIEEQPHGQDECETPYIVDSNMVRLLMYNPLNSDREVCIWKNPAVHSGGERYIPGVSLLLQHEWQVLATYIDQFLQICVPDHLVGMGCLTFIENGYLALYMGFTKDSDDAYTIYNPLTHKYEKKNKAAMQILAAEYVRKVISRDFTDSLKDEEAMDSNVTPQQIHNAKPKPISPGKADDSWNEEEAIMVILDTSGSMSNSIFNERNLQRIEAAKQFFGAFILRTQAYNFRHAVGFITFNTVSNERVPLKKISAMFEKSFQDLGAGGGTGLHGAMMLAAQKLVAYTRNMPGCKRRILCLTDGYEGGGSGPGYIHNPVDMANYLIGNNVVADTILIVEDSRNVQQKAISHATGGSCFMPNSLTNGLSLFEMETLLSIRLRSKQSASMQRISQQDYLRYTDITKYPFDEHLQSTYATTRLATISVERVVYKVEAIGKESCVKRVWREIQEFRKTPMPNIDVFPCHSKITEWLVLMKGPSYSPYSSGLFQLHIKFSDMYPKQPPDVRFITPLLDGGKPLQKIYHCNINSYGRICHRALAESYAPGLTMKDIIGCIYSLLMCPDPEDPLDSVIGLELILSLKSDQFHRSEFWRKAEQHTRQNAIPKEQYEVKKKELSGNK